MKAESEKSLRSSGTCRRISKAFWYRCPACEKKLRGVSVEQAARRLVQHMYTEHGAVDCPCNAGKYHDIIAWDHYIEIGAGDAFTQHCILAALGGET